MTDKSDTITQGKRLLTMEDMCTRWGCTKWVIYRKIDKREIPFIAIGPRKYRFDPAGIEKWEKDHTMKTVDEI